MIKMDKQEKHMPYVRKIQITLDGVNFYDARYRCDFPGIDYNLYLFHISTGLVESCGCIRTNTTGYGFKELRLISPAPDAPEQKCFQIFHVSADEDRYPNNPDYVGNRRTASSSILYGILSDQEHAKSHCEELTQKLRETEIKKLLEDEKRNKGLSEKDKAIYGELEIIIK